MRLSENEDDVFTAPENSSSFYRRLIFGWIFLPVLIGLTCLLFLWPSIWDFLLGRVNSPNLLIGIFVLLITVVSLILLRLSIRYHTRSRYELDV